MYNYQAPGQYSRPPGYGGFPGQSSSAPGMAPPPGMGAPPPPIPAPGVTPPPGIQQAQNPLPGRPSGLPPNFQPPAGMPNINFSAPVIRLGTTGPARPAAPEGQGSRRESAADSMSAGSRRGLGLGHDYRGTEQQRQQIRETLLALQPPTREEIARTIFIGNITEGVGGDEGLERILRTAGNLRRWTRATDADNKPCKFGFAEYEDAESLETAAEIFKDVQVPVKKQDPNKIKDEEEEKIGKTTLLVVVDEASMKYAEEWKSRRDEDETAAQFRIDTAKETLSSVLAGLFYPQVSTRADTDGDTAMQDGDTRPDGTNAEVVTIPLTIEDELSDIPAEMRETVAAEIAAFRDRSNRRDLERLRREEEMEAAERQRNLGGPKINRLGSPPPPTAPSGPGGGANGIPLGPRDRGIQGAPSGPKGFQSAQIPRDYQGGVTFINGSGINGAAEAGWIRREDEDDSASDSEIENRHCEKKETEQEKLYLDYERRWLNRERSRAAALEREKNRDKEEEAAAEKEKEAVAKRLKEWNDDIENARKVEEYYQDRSLWLRNRSAFRSREAAADNLDRENEDREKARDFQKREDARGMADSFLARQAEELGSRVQTPREPQKFKMSLGAAAQKVQAAAAPRRTAAEVEGLLEDEEENEASTKRTLIPIKFDTAAEAASLTDEERAQAARQLASDIPTDKEGLWKWDVRWEFVDDTVVLEQLKPFVEKKIVEYLGVQEQMLVDVVDEHIRKRGKPEELVAELEGALDEEAEVLVKKLWRMLIFFSESEKRGIAS